MIALNQGGPATARFLVGIRQMPVAVLASFQGKRERRRMGMLGFPDPGDERGSKEQADNNADSPAGQG
ncbi:MAG: hypothetical protein AXA67_11190 [Methylothermaceae bacteria B42]|nr:MAG: hypothetical protein AXA67_11190 [Methylothermaceae bacteria B42]